MKYIQNPISCVPLCVALTFTSTVSAAPITWDGGAVDGGLYETDLNWEDNVAPADDLTTDIATLVGGTVDLSTTRQVAGLDYNVGSTLSGVGSLEIGTSGIEVNGNSFLSTAGVVLNQANTTITFAGGRLSLGASTVTSGTGALTLTGANTLYVDGGANTYSGGTTVTGGATASIKNGDALGTGSLTLDNGTLQANGTNWAFDETITVNAGGGTIDANNNVITLNSTAVISGTGAMTFKATSYGDRIKIDNTVNTYTGDTTIDNTKVWMKNTSALPAGDITLQNGGTIKNWNTNPNFANNIIVDSSGGGIESGWGKTITLSGVISGDGELTITPDSGTVKMNNDANTYSGGTKILGLIAVEGGNNQLGTGTITFDGGFMRNDNSSSTFAQDVVFAAGGAEIQVGWIGSNRRLEFTGVISGPGALVVSDDEAHLRLLNTGNTYAGGTEIRGLVNAVSGGLGSGDVTLNNIPYIETIEEVEVVTDRGRGWLQNWLGEAVHANNLIISDANLGGRLKAGWDSNLEFTGVVSGAGTLAIEGDGGTAVFSGTANTFTGDINLLATNSRLRVASLGGGTYSGNVSGDGIFDYAFPTTPTLDGTYTHTGGTAISLVTVSATDFPSLNCFNSGQNIILAAGGTLDLAGTAITNGFLNPEGGTLLNSGAAVDLSANTFTTNGGTFTVDGSGDITLGDISYTAGTPTVVKDGSNTLTLTGAADNIAFRAEVNDGKLILAKTSGTSEHAIGGLLTINGGTVELGGTGGDQIYFGSRVTVNNGTFDINTRDERFQLLDIGNGVDNALITGTSGQLRVNAVNAGNLGFISAKSGTVSATLIGDAPLEKTTAGTVTLSGANTNTGDITVTEGTLTLTQVNPNNESATVSIAATGATLNLTSGAPDTVDKLFIGGVQQDAGEYGNSASVLPIIATTQITGTGTLIVSSGPPVGFSGWVTGTFANGTIDGGEQGPNDDPDGDGIVNLFEYAIDGQDPTVANSTIGSFVDNLLSYTKNTAATGLTYAIEESTDLGVTDDWTEVSGAEYTNDGSTISYDLPVGTPKNFIRLSVTED